MVWNWLGPANGLRLTGVRVPPQAGLARRLPRGPGYWFVLIQCSAAAGASGVTEAGIQSRRWLDRLLAGVETGSLGDLLVEDFDLSLDLRSLVVALDFQIESGLEVDPELRRGPKKSR